MSGTDKRLDRLYGGLTAKERALLVLQAYKEGREVEPAIWMTIPTSQSGEYNRRVALINALNGEVASVIHILHEQAGKVSLRLAWLQTMQLWGSEVQVLGKLLLARDNGGAARVRRDVRTLLKRAPSFDDAPFDLEKPLEQTRHEVGRGDELARALAMTARDTLLQHWCELRAIEIAVEESREEFDGEDPLHPDVRRLLDAAKQTLVAAHRDVAPFAGGFALPEPDQDLVNVRLLIAKVIEKS